jgi:hypothetical protein
MERFQPGFGHDVQVPKLHAHPLVGADHVRLHDDAHIFFEDERLQLAVGGLPGA